MSSPEGARPGTPPAAPPSPAAPSSPSLSARVASPDRDKGTLKVHLPNGGFNVVKFDDAIDVKVETARFFFIYSVSQHDFVVFFHSKGYFLNAIFSYF